MCVECRSKYLETYWDSDVEMLAMELHEAGRKAFDAGTTVAQAQQKDKAFPFVEWDGLTEQAKEGKRIQARHLIEKFRIELPHGGERAELQPPAAKPRLLMWDKYVVNVDFEALRRELNAYMGKGEGYELEEAKNGDEALAKTEEDTFDLIILDIMMPGMDGYHTCMEIRKKSNAPILFLSAKTQEGDKMLGFSSGGDDYLAKPFSYNELVSRAKALIRRYQVYKGKQENVTGAGAQEGIFQERQQISAVGQQAFSGRNILRLHDLEINETSETVTRDGCPVDLTDTEYEVLHLLVKNRRQIFSAERLYEAVWQEPYYYGANNTVMVHIRNLRRKIEKDPKNPELIKTVWGRGYRCD